LEDFLLSIDLVLLFLDIRFNLLRASSSDSARAVLLIPTSATAHRITIKDSSIRFRIPISVSSYEVLDYDSVIVT
jgi:hypothetical protein